MTIAQGEQATDAECTVPEANSCHRRRCECIAHGCDGPDCASEPAAQVEAFQRCGCKRYGNLIPAKTSGCACLEPGGIGGGGDGGGGGNGGGGGGWGDPGAPIMTDPGWAWPGDISKFPPGKVMIGKKFIFNKFPNLVPPHWQPNCQDIWIPGNQIHHGLEPLLAGAYICLSRSGHPMAAAILGVLVSTNITLSSQTDMRGKLGYTLGPGCPWILLSTAFFDWRKKKSFCDMLQILFHEAAHLLGYVLPEWKNWFGYDYSKVYGYGVNQADTIAIDLINSCCCGSWLEDEANKSIVIHGGLNVRNYF